MGAEVILKDLSKAYGSLRAVREVSLTVYDGEFCTLLGPSGSGKTTILRMIAGFMAPSSGDIKINGTSVVREPAFRRNIGMVFQNLALFPHMNVRENIAFPLKMRNMGRSETRKRVGEILELVRMGGFEARKISQLSGGQQQRVALARALVFNPPVLLMDEPLSALDKDLRRHMQREVKSIQTQLGLTAIYVTHDQSEALTMSDRIAIVSDGAIEQVGTPRDVYEMPVSSFVGQFVGESNVMIGTVGLDTTGRRVLEIEGGIRIAVPEDCDVPVEKRARMLIRPEKLAIGHSQSSLTGTKGTIEDAVYVGDAMEYRVRVSSGLTLDVKEMKSQVYKVGDPVYVSWDLSASRVWPEQ